MTEQSAIFPWQNTQWEHFNATRNADHLPHALLLTGSDGIGKSHFATILANSLLCEQVDDVGYSCGHCTSCKVKKSGAHPDYKAVGLPEGKQLIPINAIRELIDFLTLSRSYNGNRVVLISSADKMNDNAANSLLKSLEEPPPKTVIILVADQAGKLPLTLRSRCQYIAMFKPEKVSALAWLAQQNLQNPAETLLSFANDKPLLALAMDSEKELFANRNKFAKDLITVLQQSHSITSIAKDWQKADLETLLNWQIKWLQAVITRLVVKDDENLVGNKFLEQILVCVSDTGLLWRLHADLLHLKAMTDYPLNKLMFVESMLLLWRDVGRTSQ